MTLQEAFNDWVRHRPFKKVIQSQLVFYYDKNGVESSFVEPAHWDGDCCYSRHFYRDAAGGMTWKPKEDHDVCPRERAWRVYVRIRDGLPEKAVVH